MVSITRTRGRNGIDKVSNGVEVLEEQCASGRRLRPKVNQNDKVTVQSFERRLSPRLKIASESKSKALEELKKRNESCRSRNQSGGSETKEGEQNENGSYSPMISLTRTESQSGTEDSNGSCVVNATDKSPLVECSMSFQPCVKAESGDNRRLSPIVEKQKGTPQKTKRYNHAPEDGIVPKRAKLSSPKKEESKAVRSIPQKVEVPISTTNHEDSSPSSTGKTAAARVKETLRTFNTLYLRYVQQEEDRCRKPESTNVKDTDDVKSKKAKHTMEENSKKTSKRPDLKAITEASMKGTNAVLYAEKKIGDLAGIHIGYQFYSRAEMAVVGFHHHWLNGIDYIPSSNKTKMYKNHKFPLAVSIVVSGQYEDDVDNLEELEYTGQGGNDLLGNKQQIKDQVLLRGNLALKNNMEQCVPVRVIRGHKCTSSYCGKIYTYDGLYKVVQFRKDKGKSDFVVFKYQLRRVEGQPRLTTNQVLFTRGDRSKVNSALPGLICKDLSDGQEDLAIAVTNVFDDPPIGVSGYTYTKCLQYSKGVKMPPSAPGCNCEGYCTNPKTCACAKLNGSDFPYVSRNGGRLIEAKDVVFECGPNCGCGPGCVNRTSQQGLKYRLEVYRTPDKGWAVRSRDFILAGAPVCEYIGVVRRSDELNDASDNVFIFDIDCWQTIKGIEGRERRYKDVPETAISLIQAVDNGDSDGEPEYCIDAGSTGNLARFINHSCEPNLFVQCVLSSHHDVRLARIVLIAADNIPPLQELAYDYGYALDSMIGPDGKFKVLPCLCGAAGCRKRLY
ncbi:hypothetical protein Droror1_Dr00013069 [Drosera rotundifolia]